MLAGFPAHALRISVVAQVVNVVTIRDRTYVLDVERAVR